jgi:hypothetical protein
MWVVEQTGNCPKDGAAPAKRRTANGPRREPATVSRTEAEAYEQMRRLEQWATAGVGQSYHAAMIPTYAVRPVDPPPPPMVSTEPCQQPFREGGSP